MTLLFIVQIVVSILLIVVILLQSQSSSLGGAFGGSGGWYHTKRGFEKVLFISTIILAILFVFLSIIQIVL